jgi:hypothetical protein
MIMGVCNVVTVVFSYAGGMYRIKVKIQGSWGSNYEDSYLLGYGAM